MKHLIIFLTLLTVYSCSTSRHVTGLVEHASVDTLYLSNVQYDSIYVFQDRQLDRSRDTLLIRETNTEFRYKLLRDTVYKVQHDSIPYEVRIETVKEVNEIPGWCKCLSLIGGCTIVLLILLILWKLR